MTSPPTNKAEAATSTPPTKAAAMTRPPKEAEETSLHAMAAEAATSIPLTTAEVTSPLAIVKEARLEAGTTLESQSSDEGDPTRPEHGKVKSDTHWGMVYLTRKTRTPMEDEWKTEVAGPFKNRKGNCDRCGDKHD